MFKVNKDPRNFFDVLMNEISELNKKFIFVKFNVH